MASNLSMQPKDAAEISEMFSRASASERAAILHNLHDTAAAGLGANSRRARQARHRDAGDGRVRRRHRELHAGARRDPDLAVRGLPRRWSTIPAASRWPAPPRRWTCRARCFSACCCFSSPNSACRCTTVYRLSRLYDRLSERSALVMLAAWRGSTMAVDPRQIPSRTLRRRTPARARGDPRRPVREQQPGSRRHRAQRHATGSRSD